MVSLIWMDVVLVIHMLEEIMTSALGCSDCVGKEKVIKTILLVG